MTKCGIKVSLPSLRLCAVVSMSQVWFGSRDTQMGRLQFWFGRRMMGPSVPGGPYGLFHQQLGSLTLASLLRQTLWYTSPAVPVEPWTPEEPTHQASGLRPHLPHGR